MNPNMPCTSFNNAPMMPQNNNATAPNNFSMSPYLQAMAAYQQPQMNLQMVQMMLGMMGNLAAQSAPYMFGGMPQNQTMNGFPSMPQSIRSSNQTPQGPNLSLPVNQMNPQMAGFPQAAQTSQASIMPAQGPNMPSMMGGMSPSLPMIQMPPTLNAQPSVPDSMTASATQQQKLQNLNLDHDSGNETSSISPQSASTVETPSNSGLPSRSGSFSTANNAKSVVRRLVESAPIDPSTPKRRKTDGQINQVQQFAQMGQFPQAPFFAPQMMMHPAYMGQNFNMMNPMGMSPMAMNPMAMHLDFDNCFSKQEACVVCGDKSSGYHYHALSCEGCKGFFRRAVQQKLNYKCHKQEQCEMNKDTRTRCQKCRFQKCLDAGMKPELVHPKKSKKAGKENEPDQETLRLCHQLTKMISTAFNASFGNVVDEIKKGDTPALLDADFDELKRMATKFVSKFVEVGEEEREKLVDSSLRAFLAVIGAYVISQRDELATAHVFNQDPMTVADMNEVKDMLDFEHMTADTLAIVAAMTFTISTPKISTEAREAITKLHERFTTSYSFMSNDVQNSSGMPAIYSFANSMRKFY